MANEITVKMIAPDYLIRFMESLYGGRPVRLKRKDPLAAKLYHFLNKPPKDYKESAVSDGMLLISIPDQDDKNVLYNNYLSESEKIKFVEKAIVFMKLTFRDDVDKSRYNGFNMKESIEIFMEKFDLNDCPTVYDVLERDYRRYFNLKYIFNHRRKKKKKKSSV